MAFNVSYIFTAVNKFSSTARKIKQDMSTLRAKADRLSVSLGKIGKGMKGAAGATRNYSLVAGGFLANAVRLWAKQADAIAQVEQGIISTGGAAGFTLKQLQKEASRLQDLSTFGDEEILQGVTAQLLTFGNIAGNQFKAAQVAAMDLAARLKIDLKSASIQLGKALDDPSRGLSMLGRSGITFSEQQQKVIKALQASGRLADAQNLILKEVNKQYGGSAAAAAKYGSGALKQMSNTLGDVNEQLGGVIAEVLLPSAKYIKAIAQQLQGANPWVKRAVVGFIALVAVISPLLAALGFLTMGMSALSATSFTTMASLMLIPIAMAAVGYASFKLGRYLYDYFEPVQMFILDTIEKIDLLTQKLKGGDLTGFAKDFFKAGLESSPYGMLLKGAESLFKGDTSKKHIEITVNDKGGNISEVKNDGKRVNMPPMATGLNMGASL